jgi:hypothetical protein
VATSVIDPGIPIPPAVLAISKEVSGDPALAREIFDAMVREVDKIDDSYKR